MISRARTGLRISGRRGVFLVLFGVVYIAIGLSYVFPPEDRQGKLLRHTMSWMPWWSPLWACGLLWVAAGIVAIGSSMAGLGRDRFGFGALSGVAWGWSCANLGAWLSHDSSRGWVNMLVFAVFGVAVQVVAGMLNPPVKLRTVK